MVLRQVDWSLRYHLAAATTWRHLRLARLVTSDISHSLARWAAKTHAVARHAVHREPRSQEPGLRSQRGQRHDRMFAGRRERYLQGCRE